MRTVSFLLVMFFASGLFSQTKREIDSLKHELGILPPDTNKVNVLNNLSNKTKNVDYSESLEYAEKALELADSIEFERGILKAYTNIGFCYYSFGYNTKAIEYYDKALQLTNELNNMHQKVIIYNYYYLLYKKIESYDKAAEYAFKALDVAEEIKMDAGVSALYINIGLLYLYQENIERSKEYFLQALEIAEKINHQKKIAIINLNLGVLCVQEKDFEGALDYYQKSLNTYQKIESYSKLMNINLSIANVLQRQGKGEEALVKFKKALRYANKLKDSILISRASNKLALCHKFLNNNDSAYYYANMAYRISLNFKNFINTSESSYLLYKLNYQAGNYKIACDYLEIYKQMGDSLSLKERFVTLNNLEAQYVLRKHEKKIKLIELEKSMLTLKSLFIILLIIMLSVIIIQRLNKRRLKNKKDKEIFSLKLSKAKAELKQKKAELKAFTFTIIEKNKKIDELNDEITRVEKLDDLKDLNRKKEELRNLRILTEDDWVKFKNIFSEVYSEFTLKTDQLKLSLSEGDKRQLMLIKLGFSISQSAEVLGVGYKAIQKARQRLAQKFNLESSKDLFSILENDL